MCMNIFRYEECFVSVEIILFIVVAYKFFFVIKSLSRNLFLIIKNQINNNNNNNETFLIELNIKYFCELNFSHWT